METLQLNQSWEQRLLLPTKWLLMFFDGGAQRWWCSYIVYIDLPVSCGLLPCMATLLISCCYYLVLGVMEFTHPFPDASHPGGKVGQEEGVLLAKQIVSSPLWVFHCSWQNNWSVLQTRHIPKMLFNRMLIKYKSTSSCFLCSWNTSHPLGFPFRWSPFCK